MGFPVAIFADRPDEDLICAICHDVLESPICCPCGHSFCRSCLDSWLETGENCPTCRQELSDNVHPNGTLERLLLKSTVSCKNALKDQASARRRLNDGKAHTDVECEWTGKLDDWQKHAMEECPLQEIDCSVEACDWRCARKDMREHMACEIVSHMELMVNAKAKAIERRFEAKLKRQLNQQEKKFEQALSEQKQALVELTSITSVASGLCTSQTHFSTFVSTALVMVREMHFFAAFLVH